MKIAFFSPTAHGGQPAYVREVLTALSRINSRFELALVTRVDLENEFITEEYNVFPVLPVLKNRADFNNKLSWAINRLLHYIYLEILLFKFCFKRKIDIVHLQEITPFFSIVSIFLLKRVLGAKVVLTLHNVKPHKYPKFLPKKIVDFGTKIRIKLADRVFVHTGALRAAAISLAANTSRDKFVVAPHGVWSYYKNGECSGHKRDGIFFFGALRENKGINLLLDALLLLLEQGHRVPVIIGGKTEDYEYFRGRVAPLIKRLQEGKYPISFYEKFLDYGEISEFAARSRYLALPYVNFSAQSGVLFDAIALSIPIITTPGHSIAEFVEAYNIGFVAKSSSPQDLADAILDAFSKPASLDSEQYDIRFSNLRSELSWEKHARVLMEAYSE